MNEIRTHGTEKYQVDGFYIHELKGGAVSVYPCDAGMAVWR